MTLLLFRHTDIEVRLENYTEYTVSCKYLYVYGSWTRWFWPLGEGIPQGIWLAPILHMINALVFVLHYKINTHNQCLNTHG